MHIENAAGSSYERIILDMIEKKCFYMAASSILTELAIEATKKAEVFINAQEMFQSRSSMEPTCLVYSHIR